MCMSLISKFFPQLTCEKNCENWSIFSEDMEKYNSLLFWPTLYKPTHTELDLGDTCFGFEFFE